MMRNGENGQKEVLRQFGDFTLDLERRGLYRGPQRLRLTAKPLETLIFMVENRGRIIEKHEILDAVWKDTCVTECTLVQAVREIRRVLGDDKEDPRFIQTVPRQGYRFVARVSLAPAPCKPEAEEVVSSFLDKEEYAAATTPSPTVEPVSQPSLWCWIVPFGLGLAFGLVLGFLV